MDMKNLRCTSLVIATTSQQNIIFIGIMWAIIDALVGPACFLGRPVLPFIFMGWALVSVISPAMH